MSWPTPPGWPTSSLVPAPGRTSTPWRGHCHQALISGITSAAGVVSAVIILRQLRADRRAVLASAIARDS